MTVKDLAERLNMKPVTSGDMTAEIKNCYICDMLSFAMARVCPGDAWITVQTNVNVVAVASLSDCACVIIPEDIPVESATIEKANAQNTVILSASQTAFEIAHEIGKQIK